ncbi:MAG: ABC transporter substrate-binding protein, partial [Alphaproteobacteria bacterium]|nr:ABC transporter substrate-binding protein [Alphaproteobacteria bacterium]
SMIAHYQDLVQAGAEAILFVANDREGAIMVREVAALPEKQRIPFISHWGVTGGDFFEKAGKDNLAKVDYSIIQTFSFFKADPRKVEKILARTKTMFNVSRIENIDSPVGFAHAYDLTHILAKAIALAGTTDRAKIRDAMERVQNVDGLAKRYERPFAPDRHEAATPDQILFVKFDANGVLVPIPD